MKLTTFHYRDEVRLGVSTEKGLVDIAAAGTLLGIGVPQTASEFYSQGLDGLKRVRLLMDEAIPQGAMLSADTIELGPAVPQPGKILCVGLNYSRHAAESGMDAPDVPVLFGKFANSVAAHGEDVPMSSEWKAVDYEAELAVIIGQTARHVSEDQALDYVLGYANANDLSERDLQLKQPGGQWLLGKTLDKFLPLGPYVLTADEVPDPQNLAVRGWLNGELRQDSNTSDMIFSVAEVIAFASRYFTLQPGDVISTGTPEGVILGMEQKTYMRPGDEYTVEIGPLGKLTNRMVGA